MPITIGGSFPRQCPVRREINQTSQLDNDKDTGAAKTDKHDGSLGAVEFDKETGNYQTYHQSNFERPVMIVALFVWDVQSHDD